MAEIALANPVRAGNDLFFPIVILDIKLVDFIAVLLAVCTDDRFIIDMQRDPVMIGQLLRQDLPPVSYRVSVVR